MTLYFITVFEKAEMGKLGFPEMGASRVWGFYQNRDDAVEALHTNMTDLWETVYNYAVLEEIEEGISGCTHNRQFFKYNRFEDGYFEISEPEGYEHFVGFAMG